jgi:peptidoglycan/LPS O-acetylase OafA/YrhL
MGDFYSTPYVLNGVEWTLRVEIMFYLTILILSIFNLLKRPKLLLFIFLIVTLFCKYSAPFPVGYGWSDGYFTTFFPFLFIGSAFFMYEKKEINSLHLGIFSLLIFGNGFLEFTKFHPGIGFNFAFVACTLFILAWMFRAHFKINLYIVIFSELTYVIYLFHNWLWSYILRWVAFLDFSPLLLNIIVLSILLLVCLFVNKVIEKPFLKLKYKLVKN